MDPHPCVNIFIQRNDLRPSVRTSVIIQIAQRVALKSRGKNSLTLNILSLLTTSFFRNSHAFLLYRYLLLLPVVLCRNLHLVPLIRNGPGKICKTAHP